MAVNPFDEFDAPNASAQQPATVNPFDEFDNEPATALAGRNFVTPLPDTPPTLRKRMVDWWAGVTGEPAYDQQLKAANDAEATAILVGRKNVKAPEPDITPQQIEDARRVIESGGFGSTSGGAAVGGGKYAVDAARKLLQQAAIQEVKAEQARDDLAWESVRQGMGGMSQVPQMFAENAIKSATGGVVSPVIPTKPHSWQSDSAGGAGDLTGFIAGPAKLSAAAIGRVPGARFLAPAAEDALAARIAKSVASQSATLGLASAMKESGSAALDSTSVDEAAGRIGRATLGGLEMGAEFGLAGSLFPKSTPSQWIARASGVSAAQDLMHGTTPWDDRPLHNKVFDYGANIFFTRHGDGRIAPVERQDTASRQSLEARDATPEAVRQPEQTEARPQEPETQDRAQERDLVKVAPGRFDYGEYSRYRQALESGGGKADAANPNSSALGPDQFIKDTWLGLVGRYKPEWADGLTEKELLALRTDPAKSAEMVAHFDQENAQALRLSGMPVTNETLYASHHFGPGKGVQFAKAGGDTPMADILTPAQMRANSYLDGLTKDQAISVWNRRAGKAGADVVAGEARAPAIERRGQGDESARVAEREAGSEADLTGEAEAPRVEADDALLTRAREDVAETPEPTTLTERVAQADRQDVAAQQKATDAGETADAASRETKPQPEPANQVQDGLARIANGESVRDVLAGMPDAAARDTANAMGRDFAASAKASNIAEFMGGLPGKELAERARRAMVVQDPVKALRELAEMARTPGNENRTIRFVPVSETTARAIREAGLRDVSGYTHTADLFSLRHILKEHGDAKSEVARGNLPVTHADIAALPDVVSKPDKLVLGQRNKIGRDVVISLKRMPDGTTLYVEEIRTGARSLAAQSMRKYPATTPDSSIIEALRHIRSKPTSRGEPIVVDLRAREQASTTVPDAGHLGRDSVPLAEGGKPFKMRAQAAQEKKMRNPSMRVVSVDGGWALADKTPAQLAAQARAARRLSVASAGQAGQPIAAHEFIAVEGGLSRSVASDLGVEGNQRIGNRWLYASKGKGLTLEQATEKLLEAGYIRSDSHNEALDVIRRSLKDPQYTPEGWDRILEAEAQTRYEDYLEAHGEDVDPIARMREHGATEEELAQAMFSGAPPELQAEVLALRETAESLGIDVEAIIEYAAKTGENLNHHDYLRHERYLLAEAIARNAASHRAQADSGGGRQARGQEAKPRGGGDAGADHGDAGAPKNERGATGDANLTSYSEADLRQREQQRQAAETERKRQEKDAAQRAQADAERGDFTLIGSDRPADEAEARGQRTMFSRGKAETTDDALTEQYAGLAALNRTMRRVRGSDQAKEVRDQIVGHTLTNVETGITATVSGESWRKMMSKSNVDRSVSSQAHMQALGNLDHLFRLSTLEQTRPGKKAGDAGRVSEVQHFVVPMPFDGDVLQVRILAKRYVDQQQGNRLYLVEAVEIGTPASFTGESASSYEARSPHRPAGVDSSFAQMVAAVKRGAHDGDDALFSFAGQKAKTADSKSLSHAVDMKNGGSTPSEILKQTGWHEGSDGKWRFEIGDKDARLTIGGKGHPLSEFIGQLPSRNGWVSLDGLLDHPALFAAYPELRTLNVKLLPAERMVGAKGSIDQRNNAILLDASLPAHEALSTLLHEIQHGIQHIEGFATGGSESRIAIAQDQARHSIPNLRSIVREAQRSYDDAVSLGHPEKLLAQRKAALDEAKADLEENLKLANAGHPHEQYRRMAGEVESRNTQARQHMTDAERRGIEPSSTADVPAQDVIVTFNGKDAASAPAPANARDAEGFLRGAGMPHEAVQSIVDAIKGKWKNAPEIVVARNMADERIPQAVREQDASQRSQGASGDVEGFFHEGKVYVLADHLASNADVARVVLHESVGHYGLRGVFGEKLGAVLDQLAWQRRGELAAKARQYGLVPDHVPADALPGHVYDAMDKTSRRIAAEEMLADLAEKQPQLGFVKRSVAAIRSWLRENMPGFEKLAMSDSEIIRDIIMQARRFVREGPQAKEGDGTVFSRADYAQGQMDGKPYKPEKQTLAAEEKQALVDAFNTEAGRKARSVGEVEDSTDIYAKSAALRILAEKEGYKVGYADPRGKYMRLEKGEISIPVRVSDHANVNRGAHFKEAAINLAPDEGSHGPAFDTFESALWKLRNAGVDASGDLTFDGEEPAYFSRAPDTKARYESRIDELFAGGKAREDGVRVLDRSDVLALMNLGDGPVKLAEGKVIAGRTNHPKMTAALWKKVPGWLENPAAVFDSDTVPGRLVFVAPELVDGATARLVLDPNVKDRSGGATVHLLINAYDAPGRSPFGRWINEGKARFIDQKEFPAILTRLGLQLPNVAFQNKPGTRRILTEKNLAGWRKANADAGVTGAGESAAPKDSGVRFKRTDDADEKPSSPRAPGESHGAWQRRLMMGRKGAMEAAVKQEALAQRDIGRGLLRSMWAKRERSVEQAQEAFREATRYFDKNGEKANLEAIDQYETGGVKAVQDAASKPFFAAMDKGFEQRVRRIQELAPDAMQHLIEHYFPHLWEDPTKAAAWYQSVVAKRPLQGDRSFLKQRTHGTIKEGMESGLKPISTNPVDHVLAKMAQMDKFITFLEMRDDLKGRGWLKKMQAGERVPAGYARVEDPAFQIAGGLQGYFAVPEMIARDINNYLSPSLYRFSGFKAFRTVQNTMMSARLGWSAFHAGFTTLDNLVTHFDVGGRRLLIDRDIAGGLKTLAGSLMTPFTSPWEGGKLNKMWMGKVKADPNTYAILGALEQGGARMRMSATEHNAALMKMRRAIDQGSKSGMLKNILPAVGELSSWVIHQKLVPAQKMSARVLLMKYELDSIASKLGRERGDYAGILSDMRPDAIRQIAGRVVDTVDNRLGQMTYDNQFWNKTARECAQVAIGAVGWQVGTVRTVTGALRDIKNLAMRTPDKLLSPLDIEGRLTGEHLERTANLTYFMSLALVMGGMGAALQYMLTGNGPGELKDYFFPKTGRTNPDGTDERVSFPSYWMDHYKLATHPIQTASHKLHPVFSTFVDTLTNKDFFGNKVRDEDATWAKQAAQVGKYVAEGFLPYSAKNIKEMNKTETPAAMMAASFFGIAKAPASVSRTTFQAFVAEHGHSGKAMTPDQAENSQARRDAIVAMRQGENPDLANFSPAQKQRMRAEARQDPTVVRFNRLSLTDKLRAWDRATDAERERYKLRALILRSYANSFAHLPPDQKQEARQRIDAVRGWGRESEEVAAADR